LGKLAQTRSADGAVKTFAAQSVKTYEKISEELRAVAQSRHIGVPTALDREHARVVHSVSAKPPSEFATAFSKSMSAIQEQTLTLLSDASALSDKDLRSFAERTIPLLERQRAALSSLPFKEPQTLDAAGRVAVDPDAASAAQAQRAADDSTTADQAQAGVVDADAAARRAAEGAAETPKDTSEPMPRK
jgi:hypothetical protein